MRGWVGAAVAAGTAAWAGAALAQAPNADPEAAAAPAAAEAAPTAQAGVTSYPASFFNQFRPTSARDMVQNVPGFSFESGENVRGFGGAAGNVLIDGQRPTTKSVDLDNILQRIPADSIVRVDVIRGGAPGIDMQGQPVIANVVRRTGASSVRTLQLTVKPYPQFGFWGYFPRLEQSYRSGPFSFDGSISARRDKHVDSGEGHLVRTRPSGLVFEQGEFESDLDIRSFGANGAGEFRASDATYRLNGSVNRSDNDRQEQAFMTDAAGGAFVERSRNKTRGDRAEVGADYERDLSGWLTLRVLGLKTFKADKVNGVSESRGAPQQSTEYATSGETIFRTVLAAAPSERVQVEFGGEGAFNYLDARSSLISGGVPVVLPSANVRVEERRAEGFATANWKFGALALETAARYETSTISQTGGVSQKKTLSFFKPRVFASYPLTPTTDLRLRIERTVGQLNFKDFAATAELDAGTVNAGNPNLEPERAWVFEGVVEQRFWSGGAVVLTLRHEEVQAVVDLIPVGGRFNAPGNIGDGTRGEARVGLTLPFAPLGLDGVTFRGGAAWRWSSVTDPVTGLERRIARQRPFEFDFTLTKAAPSLRSTFILEAAASGGGSSSGYYEETSYRISEIRIDRDDPVFKVIWDWTPRASTVIRFQVENALGKTRTRERILFTGPRSAGVVNFTEVRTARIDPFFFVRLRQRI